MRNPAEGPKLPPQATGVRPVPEDESGDTGTPLCPALPAELNYVDDSQPGIRRRRLRGKFAYYTAQGERITDEVQVHRINSHFASPPAYRDVWICADPQGHLEMDVVAFQAVADLHRQGALPAQAIQANQLLIGACWPSTCGCPWRRRHRSGRRYR
ncbi:hypothetical protein SSTU70S_03931 [Stutzerimonas stutzeri]